MAEFSLAYHGLKKELRSPVLAELWKLNVRHLSLSQLFELATQAEVTAPTTLFPRLAERLRQEQNFNRVNWKPRNSQLWSGNAQRFGSSPHRGGQSWPPPYREPLPVHQPQLTVPARQTEPRSSASSVSEEDR